MTDIVISPAAESDLENIWLRIAADNPRSATRLLRTLDRKIGILAIHPRIGPPRPDIRQRTHILVERPYLVLYEIHPNTEHGPVDIVEIVRVVDGRRDLRALFR